MQKNLKKVLSFVLTMVMVLGLLPFSAFASEAQPASDLPTSMAGLSITYPYNTETVQLTGTPADRFDALTFESARGEVESAQMILTPDFAVDSFELTMSSLKNENGNIVLDENGQPNDIYRITNRGGKGVKTMNITEKTGKLVAIMSVSDENDLMIINKSGITIRLKVADIRTMGRATQGVRLINLEKRNDEIASVCKVVAEETEDVITENTENEENNTIENN